MHHYAPGLVHLICADICGNGGCGAPGQSYNWSLSANGALTAAAYPRLALTAQTNSSVTLTPFTEPLPPSQRWAYDSGTGQFSAPGLGVCLSQLRPTLNYAAICGRMGAYNGFDASTTPAYCLAVFASGAWGLYVNSAPVATGNVTLGAPQANFDPSVPHRLVLNMAGPIIDAWLDGAVLTSISDSTYSSGNAAVGSGWHAVSFDNFEVTVPLSKVA